VSEGAAVTELGLVSLADHVANPLTGERCTQGVRLAQVIESAVLAEAAGFDVFGVGEHHFSDYILSAPELVLSNIAARTSRIRLGTSVTLLANVDPLRQAEAMATLDVLSAGRSEVTFARGISEETAHAFGVANFDELRPRFEEYLRLVLRLLTEEEVTWSGEHRTPLDGIRIEPRPVQRPHPSIWIGGGLSNVSADLAAELGLPLMLPSLFRWPEDYTDIVTRYRERAAGHGHAHRAKVGFPSYLHVARTSQQARERWRPFLEHYRDFARGVRGSFGRPVDYDSLLQGPAICGSPAEVIERLAAVDELLGLDRHFVLMDAGGLPDRLFREAMELMATEVLPARRSGITPGQTAAPAR
jgi:alkanesulfonate monooxygenase SsuD/methylene tetrahydromethanopterin reductase-like flavin-dependent oxidoreductase (luciferase family)